jgi:hypothetical protein
MDVERRVTQRRRHGGLGLVVVVVLALGTLLLGACSDGGGSGAGATAKPDDGAATTTTTTTTGSTSLCAIFDQLVADGAGPRAQYEATTPEGWQQRIATTGRIVDAAPPEWRDEAQAYLQMVKDRAQLAAENGYVGVQDLPADVRNDFISSHRALQMQVNELIAYMGSTCGAPASG